MAALTSSLSATEFLGQLERLQLRDDVDWGAACANVPDRHTSSVVLAQHFVAAELLTSYQAEQLLHGRGEDLRLGQYVLLDKLGQGGMGEVFKARHVLMRRLVALKLIRGELLAHSSARPRFLREVELLARLSHPHIVTAHDAEQVGDRLFLVMELCEGPNLASLVQGVGPLPVGMACACAYQAALALQHAAEHGLVHRDIKPANLLISASGLKVLDLGLARLRQTSEAPADSPLTDSGAFLGTPDFVAPEQALDAPSADIRSDLYSLGQTLYFALTGEVPFPGGTAVAKVMRHQAEEPVPLERFRPDVPPEVSAIVRRLTAKQPSARYQTAQQAAEALRPWANWDASLLRPLFTPAAISAQTILPTLTVPPEAGHHPPAIPTTRFMSPVPSTGAVAQGRPQQPRRARIWIIGGALAAATAALLLWPLLGPEPFNDEGEPLRPCTLSAPVLGPDKWRFEKNLPHPRGISSIAFSPDGEMLAVACTWFEPPSSVKIWSVATGEEIATLGRQTQGITAVAFSPDGKALASASGDLNADVEGEVLLWDTKTWKFRERVPGGDRGVMSLAFSRDGKLLALSERNKRIALWDVSGDKPTYQGELAEDATTTTDMIFLSDNRSLVAASSDGFVRIWDVRTKKARRLPPGRLQGMAWGLALSSDGQTLACVTQGRHDPAPGMGEWMGGIYLWDLIQQKLKRTPRQHDWRLWCAVFTPGDEFLVTGQIHSCDVRDAADGEPLRQLVRAKGYVTALAISPDGNRLALGRQEENDVQLWRLR